jgi:15-cis-phytoene synthase
MRGSLGLNPSRPTDRETAVVADGDALAGSAMRKHGRTFFLASLLLGERRGPIEALYRLCRHIDDIADGDAVDKDMCDDGVADAVGKKRALADDAFGSDDPAVRLSALDRALREEDMRVAFVRIALRLRDAHGLPLAGLHRLIDEARGESDFERPRDADALWRYAFGVAGVVGWMLRPLLGVRDPAATSAAVALGIAMQATNIARDVVEDAAIGRVYLPRDWAPMVDTVGLLRRDAAVWAEAYAATCRLLAAADGFYALAERGMPAIPSRPRFAIRAAARMYRDIGRLTLQRGIAGMGTRAVVSGARKTALLTAVALGRPPRFGAPALDELPQVLRNEISALERL